MYVVVRVELGALSGQLHFEKNHIENESGTELHVLRINVRRMDSRKLDQRSGFVERGCARCRILGLSVALWFTSHKLASSLLLLRASALTFLACWVPLGSTGLLGFSRKTPNKQNFVRDTRKLCGTVLVQRSHL